MHSLCFLVCIADVTDHQSCTHQNRVSLCGSCSFIDCLSYYICVNSVNDWLPVFGNRVLFYDCMPNL
jgi:hypothetical protein